LVNHDAHSMGQDDTGIDGGFVTYRALIFSLVVAALAAAPGGFAPVALAQGTGPAPATTTPGATVPATIPPAATPQAATPPTYPSTPATAGLKVPTGPAPELKPVIIKKEDLDFINAKAQFDAHNYYPAYLALLPLAHRGDPRAQYLVALMNDNGLGPVQLNVDDAARWYKAAAEKEMAEAQFALANMYSTGRGVGTVDPQQAVNWLTRSAKNGYIPGMLAVAGMHEIGIGTPRDPAAAAEWTRQAALAGSVQALYLYAARLYAGDGVRKDDDQALEWFQRAAMRGHPSAQLVLGSLVGDGLKAPSEQNIQAMMWLTLAAQRGDADIKASAADMRRGLQPNMMPSDVAEAARRARAWKPWPQFAGLAPDPAYDLPGGLNVPAPPKPAKPPAGANAAGGAAAGRGG